MAIFWRLACWEGLFRNLFGLRLSTHVSVFVAIFLPFCHPNRTQKGPPNPFFLPKDHPPIVVPMAVDRCSCRWKTSCRSIGPSAWLWTSLELSEPGAIAWRVFVWGGAGWLVLDFVFFFSIFWEGGCVKKQGLEWVGGFSSEFF